jgi:hypothetical protein
LKAIQWTRAELLLQWHAENGHKNTLFIGEKIFNIEVQYNHQNKIYAQKSHKVKENILRMMETITLPSSWFGGRCPIRG